MTDTEKMTIDNRSRAALFSSPEFRRQYDSADLNAAPSQEDGVSRQAWFIKKARELVLEREQAAGRRLTACTVTFGCQMNERDSEKLRGILDLVGFEESADENADFVIYNTCTVRENANLRVYGHLGQLLSYKKKNPQMMIALCGCMMQEPKVVEKICSDYGFVNLVFGTHNIHRFAEYLVSVLLDPEEQHIEIFEKEENITEDLPTERTYRFKSGVNIMFGCNNFCTYCIVPYVRGRERSREPKDILREVEELAADGVVEVMLLGQNVNSYGRGLEDPMTFAALLREIEKADGIERIRFMTSHPKDLSDELIETMAQSKKICHHLHLPLQSGSSALLKKMNRHYTRESYLALVDRLRAAIPDLSITTDIIVGFPGETEADIQDTIDIVRQVRYDSAFTFIYSKRTGTPAASWENQVPEDVIKDRFDRVLKEVQTVGRERSSRFVGQTEEILVESVNRQDPSLVTGRDEHNLVVHFPGTPDLIGKIVSVYLDEAKGFYYFGHKV